MEKRGFAEALDTDRTVHLRAVTERKLGPWLDSFIDYMEPFGVPDMFSIWSGLATLSAVIERRLWHTTNRGRLYSGIYTFLVGPAAAGKTLPVNEGRKLIEAIGGRFIAPSNISRAAFVDELNEAQQTIIRHGETPSTVQFNSVAIMLDELGVFISEFDRDFLSALTAMWDGHAFVERKRKLSEKIVIPEVSLTLIGACTAGFLSSLIPIEAWEQGFMSRVIIAYNGASDPVDLWKPAPDQARKFTDLVHDLKIVGNLYGQMDYSDEALLAIRAWHVAGGPPVPAHPQLKGYVGRRTAHLIKLCILICASHTDDRIITMEHYQEAINLLTRTEHAMDDVFLAMRKGGDGEVMKETWWYVYQEHRRHNRPLPHHALMRFLADRTPNHNIERMISVMLASHLLEKKTDKGVIVYVPKGTPP